MKYCLQLVFAFLLSSFAAKAQTISGSLELCDGSITALTGSPAGGTWSSSSPAVASVGSSGLVTGITAGTATITYTQSSSSAVAVITVNALPAAITGVPVGGLCAGFSVHLSSATPGGAWSSSDVSVSTVSTGGTVNGLSAGIATIFYTLPTACEVSAVVSVNPLPSPITGSSAVCVSSTMPQFNATAEGVWYSSNTSIATVGPSTGSVTGVAPGTVNIRYQLVTGCEVVKPITVNALPATITGASNICTGAFTAMSSSPSGGAWSTGSAGVISINPTTGVVSGVGAGVGHVTYSLSGTGCYTTRPITVNATPGPITGSVPVCPGGTVTLSNTVPGGAWISDSPTVATVGSGTGTTTLLSGVSGGTATISYIVGMCMATTVATVNPAASAGTLSGPSTVCAGSSITLASTVAGGLWGSATSSVATVSATGGVVAGLTAGTTTISYTMTTACGSATVTTNVTVNAMPGPITGTAEFCRGTTTVLSNSVAGGTWSTGASPVATVGLTSGLVAGVGAGTSTIFYAVGGSCFVTRIVTVDPAPGPITGGSANLCVGDILGLSDTAFGGIWGSSSTAIATIATVGGSTGVVTGISAGIVTLSYTIGSCSVTTPVTVNPLPTISSTSAPNACGGNYVLNVSGSSSSYVWSPATGLSCVTCSSTVSTAPSTITYTVTGTDGLGCSNAATVTVNGNRIQGHVTFSASAPAVADLKVWLIQFNPTDSSVIAVDSVMSCLDGSEQYYQFDSKPSGSYSVKAMLETTIPGISGYVPTYAGATPHWFNAFPATHTSGTADVRDIDMVYGTVPSGPGFIGGYVYAGGGSGETLAAGVLMLLKDAVTGQVLTYTYSNGAGVYSFGGLALGSYIVYPEEFDYYTTSSAPITLTPTAVYAINVTFRKHTDLHTIYPFVPNGVHAVTSSANDISIYPNPAKGMLNIKCLNTKDNSAYATITDLTGRVVLSREFAISNSTAFQLDISSLNAGVYFINVHSNDVNYTGKLVVE